MDPYIPEGYIMLARKVRKSSLWKSLKSTHRIVMIELLLQAQFDDGEVIRNGEILHLKRGQIATSYQQIIDDIGDKEVTIKVVRNAINKLVEHKFLVKDEEKARSKKGLLLTILNYDIYQNPSNYKLSENQVRMKYEGSKTSFSGNDLDKERGKEENLKKQDISMESDGVEHIEGKVEGKEEGITGAKQGQSEGKARAINNNYKNVNKDNIYIIFQHWNSKKIIVHRELNKVMENKINARLKERSLEDILNAIDNYHTIIFSDNHFFNYKWTLQDFMKPNNLDRFINDTEPLKMFLKNNQERNDNSFDEYLNSIDE